MGRLAAYRRKYDAVIDRLIDTVKADPTSRLATTS